MPKIRLATEDGRLKGIAIPVQAASLDIWDKKYRLKTKAGEPLDASITGTYERVARALAELELPAARKHWYGEFMWALENGAIPAGRIMSNAGAQDHKPATSTINCTVSETIEDSMGGILRAVHMAGLTLKSGAGIGYEFSTLRPRGALVRGAGAATSGPLSFMDIFNAMCFTISSAGGRRGAQMATFDISHPDILDFIRAKRENGRLRQFNLSCLITDDFMRAVEEDRPWELRFDGQVYRTLPARRVWDAIMGSTYDYAEPGFILIDRVNQMNNNWFCENIRATNPCVTADAWVQTADGPRQVRDLIGKPFLARVDGRDHASGENGFFRTATKPVVRLETAEGYGLRLTADHRVRRVTRFTRYSTETEWCTAGQLLVGDRVLLNDHRTNPHWPGAYSMEQGYLLGLLIGDGTLKRDVAILSAWRPAAVANGTEAAPSPGVQAVMGEALRAAHTLRHRSDFKGWTEVSDRGEYRLKLSALRDLAFEVGMQPGEKCITPLLEQASSDCARGFLRGFFDADGSVQGGQQKGVSVRLAQSDISRLEAVQRMLLRLGIISTLYRNRRGAGSSRLPDGKGGHALYPTHPQHELVISGENLLTFRDHIGFADVDKAARLDRALTDYRRALNRERFIARVISVMPDGVEDVYDAQVPGINTFDANGFHAHNCGEQPLPPGGSCLLGSINLTKFVEYPFADQARFNWERFRKVVSVFTRMLDNVVEINGLPLEIQRQEITRKRRHGMGFLGLGSALAMLKMRYGGRDSIEFTERVSKELAIAGWETGIELAAEKGAAPIFDEEFTVTEQMLAQRPELAEVLSVGQRVKGKDLHTLSHYMQQFPEEILDEIRKGGCRFTHHSSIAPTGTISLALANNASNGIEPSFSHKYFRNVIVDGKKTKEKVDVYSFELLAYRALVNDKADPDSDDPEAQLPDYFVSADSIAPKQHVNIQAAAQKWVDSSISKTINVPTDIAYEDFKDVYLYAWKQGLKGCTTFRYNPEAFQGVLVREADLANTTYRFKLENGETVEVKGNEEVEYDGERHTAANLYDALKEGYYGRF